jgi:hypothetical protein
MYPNWKKSKHAYEKLSQCGLSIDFVASSSWKQGLKKCVHPPCCPTPWPCKAQPTQSISRNVYSKFCYIQGKIKIKGVAQVNGHSLKLHFCMFERS